MVARALSCPLADADPHAQDPTKGTEAAWVHKRRTDISAALHQAGRRSGTSERARAAGADTWTQSHQREMEFQRRKRRARMQEHILANLMLPDEHSEAENEAAIEAAVHACKLDLKREKDHKQKMDHLATKNLHIDLKRQNISLAADVDAASVRDVVACNHMTHTTLGKAHLLVCKSPATPPKRMLWASVLTGACLVTADFVNSGGKKGVCVRMKKATSTSRLLWISRRFRQAHPGLSKLIKDIVEDANSRWKLLNSKAAFLNATGLRQRGPRRQWRTMEAIGLLTRAEKATTMDPLLSM